MLPFDECHVPPEPGPELFVRRLKAGEASVFILLSDSLWGVWTHWDPTLRRTSPHLKDKKACPGCQRKLSKRWKGYLCVINENKHAREFLELTPVVARGLLDQAGDGIPLRGLRYRIERGKGDKARCKVTPQAPYSCFKESPPLPPAMDPKQTLIDLWGLDQANFGDEEEDGPLPFTTAM